MPVFDIPTFFNWVGSNLIGFLFGVAATWITFRFERKRDDIAWKREKEKLYIQFLHEKEILIAEFEQKTKELEEQLRQRQSERIQNNILKGVDDPIKAIKDLENLKDRLTRLFVKVDEIEQLDVHQRHQSILEGDGEVVLLDKQTNHRRIISDIFKGLLPYIGTLLTTLLLAPIILLILSQLVLLAPEPLKDILNFFVIHPFVLGIFVFFLAWFLWLYWSISNIVNRK
jgi:hypothetical protein